MTATDRDLAYIAAVYEALYAMGERFDGVTNEDYQHASHCAACDIIPERTERRWAIWNAWRERFPS